MSRLTMSNAEWAFHATKDVIQERLVTILDSEEFHEVAKALSALEYRHTAGRSFEDDDHWSWTPHQLEVAFKDNEEIKRVREWTE